MKRIFQAILVLILLSVLLFTFFMWTIRASLPEQGEENPMADKLARFIQKALNREAWTQTGAIEWTFKGHEVLWDLERGLIRVSMMANVKKEYQEICFFDFLEKKQKAFKNAKESVIDSEIEEICRKGKQLWLDDLIVVEPSHLFFLPEVRRFYIPESGQKIGSLLIQFTAGPRKGDTYQFMVDDQGYPKISRAWTKKPNFYGFKISGFTMTWEKWSTTSTAIKIATLHQIGGLFQEQVTARSARTLRALIGVTDPFRILNPDPLDPSPDGQPSFIDEKQEYIKDQEENPLTF